MSQVNGTSSKGLGGMGETASQMFDRAPTEEDLLLGAEGAARQPDERGGATMSILLVRLGGETAAIPAKHLRRVTHSARPIPIPHRTGGVLRGLCNIRGELALCADLVTLLGLPRPGDRDTPRDAAADPRRMVVIGTAGDSWVFEVDSVIGVERIVAANIGPAPTTVRYALAGCTLGVLDIKDQRVTVLDGDRVLKGFQKAL